MIARRPTSKPSWRPALGSPDIVKEAASRLSEFKEPLAFFGVGAAWVAGDFVGHELFEATRGAKTRPFYFGNKLIWSLPTLLAGRLLSDYVVKGSTAVRAATIATAANALMQVRYLFTNDLEFNATVFLIHEAILLPLSFLLVGPGPATGFY